MGLVAAVPFLAGGRELQGGDALPRGCTDEQIEEWRERGLIKGAAEYEADDAADPADPPDDDPVDYSKLKKPELEAEVAERGLTVEGSGSDGAVVVKDLVAALEADDAADPADPPDE